MANPTQVTLTTAGTWYKIASGVTHGWIYIQDLSMNYFYTYRLAGDTAPSGSVADEIPFPATYQDGVEISSSEAIDVYVKADENSGSIVVSI